MSAIEQYYMNQAGGGAIPYYIGSIQKGHGIGSIFSSLLRIATPLIKPLLIRGAKAGGRAILKKVASKISQNISTPTKKRKRVTNIKARRVRSTKKPKLHSVI